MTGTEIHDKSVFDFAKFDAGYQLRMFTIFN